MKTIRANDPCVEATLDVSIGEDSFVRLWINVDDKAGLDLTAIEERVCNYIDPAIASVDECSHEWRMQVLEWLERNVPDLKAAQVIICGHGSMKYFAEF
jgi:hypothetical protein